MGTGTIFRVDRIARMPATHATTVLLVRRDGRVAMAADGQVTLGNAVVKRTAAKVRRAAKGRVLVGFAGGAADGLALFARFETKLEESNQNLERAVVELAKDWRTDRALRQLEAVMLVADAERSYLVSGQGDLIQPDEDGLLAVGSGGNFALAAARALVRHTALDARALACEAMRVAAELCIYTNDHLTVEEL
jgi:ATP-dependent HslUV protease subunit HslV